VAIYRPPRPRWRSAAVAGLAGVAIGVLAGLAIGSGEDPVDVLEELSARMRSAAGTLEVVGIEYEEAVDGGDIVAQTEYEGALAAIDRSRAQFQEVAEPLGVLSPSFVEQVTDGYEDLERLAREPVPSEELEPTIGELRELLTTFGRR
jgi:hypothetical protein